MRVSDATALSPSAASNRACAEVLAVLMTAYVALLPFQVQVTREIRFAPADCFLLLALVMAPVQLRYRAAAWSGWQWALAPLFLLGSLITTLSSGELSQYAVLNKTVGLLLLSLMYLAITSVIDDWQMLSRLVRVFVLSVVFQNIAGIVVFLATYSRGEDTLFTSQGGQRLSGMLLDPNAYGGLLVLALAFIEGGSGGPAPLFRGRLVILWRLTLLCGIMLTFSRTTWISLFLVFLSLWILRPRNTAPVLIGAMGAVVLFGTVASDAFLSFVTGMAARPEQVRSRFELVGIAWGQFTRNPLFGNGLSNFWNTEGTIVHNTPLWFLADFGLVGLFIFLGFVIWFLAKGRLARRLAPLSEQPVIIGLILGHIAMLALAMGIEAFYQRHWWLVMALIGSSHSMALRVRPEPLESHLPEPRWRPDPLRAFLSTSVRPIGHFAARLQPLRRNQNPGGVNL